MAIAHPATDTARIDPRPEAVVDHRPWGSFHQITHNESTTVKIITVDGGGELSLQRHDHRDELWTILDHGLVVEIDGFRRPVAVGEQVWIPRGTTHRVASVAGRARFLEVAFGTFDECDIERLEDRYGRS